MKKWNHCFITWVDTDKINSNGKLYYPDGEVIDIGGSDLSTILDKLSRDGWEMVACGSNGGTAGYNNIFFKKQI